MIENDSCSFINENDKVDSLNQQHTILYSNVRSILNKMLEFRALVFDTKPTIIMLCETFTRDDISKAFLDLDGYECVIRKDGTDTTNGVARGLLVYSKLGIGATEWKNPSFDNITECAGLQVPLIKSSGSKSHDYLKLVLVYRPPPTAFY